MGCGASAPKTVDGTTKKPNPKADPGPVGKPAPEDPDVGLSGSHQFVKFLGSGGTGETHLYKDRATGEEVAIKCVKRPIPKVVQPNLLREIRIQADLGEGHVNIVQAKEALLTDKHLALVMEYAACGSLTNYVTDRWQNAQATGLFLEEDEARYFFRQFISAVEYCHDHMVAHRDLKLDNTLLDKAELGPDHPPVIKLCDFGFAKGWTSDANMYTHIGTPVYMSPELIHSRDGGHGYDGKQVDVWASGILLLVMLLGTFPYDHIVHPDPNSVEAHEEVWEQQVRQSWDAIPHIEQSVRKLSAECRDLLDRIFQTDEKRRITMADIKGHAWYRKPLLPEYQAAADKVEALQAEHDEYTSHRKISSPMLKRRNDELQRMLDVASQRPDPRDRPSTTPRQRIDLRESQILDNPTAYTAHPQDEASMGDIKEDQEGELQAQQSNLRAIMQNGR